MSRKRPSTTLDDVPAASSSDDQSSSEEEQIRTAKKTTTQAKRPIATPKKSEEPKTKSAATVNKEEKKSAAPKSKASEQKSKSSAAVNTEEPKKLLFQRIWSEEDEVTLLTSLDEFSKKGLDVVADIAALHDMIKKSVDFKECTQNQVTEKIRRLKEKYKKNARKDNYAPTKAHEKQMFELSHKLWAGENNEAEPKPKPELDPVVAGFDLGAATMAAGVEWDTVVLQAVEQLPADGKADLIAKWKAIGLSKLDLCARRTQLMAEELKSFHDSLNSS